MLCGSVELKAGKIIAVYLHQSVYYHMKRALAISVGLEAILTGVSGYILYSHPEHSYFFLAALFHIPGSWAGLFAMELLKSHISSFNLLFGISAFITIFLQVLIITWAVTVCQKWKAKRRQVDL